jgi:hypothetical protein
MGVYPIPLEIDKKKFVYNIHVLKHLSNNLILGINFVQHAGHQEIFLTKKAGANLKTADIQCSAKPTLEPASNRVVTLNVITRRGYRTADACEAVVVIYVVQGGRALIWINWLGQTTMEIFHCTNHEMTIEANSLMGIMERLSIEDKIVKLIVNVIFNIQKQQLPPARPLTTAKRQYILEHACC